MTINQTLIISILFSMLPSGCTRNKDNHPSTGREGELTGKVIAVIDGDTYEALLPDNQTIKVRMEGIDAPEKGMPFYKKSKQYLADLCFGQQVMIQSAGTDQHQRVLAYTYLEDGRELSREMLKAGMAWHYKQYNSDTALANLENEARALKRGLWAEKDPMAPWTNRKLHRQGISTKDSFNTRVP
jgi:micrococcal nuclease